MPAALAIGAGTSIIGGILGSNAANAASEQEQRAAQQAISQEKAAQNQALNLQNTNYGQAQNLLNPYIGAGTGALSSLGNLLGIGSPSGTGGYGSLLQGYGSFQAPTLQQAEQQPGYQFALQQGENALQNSAAARGTLLSGATAAGIQQYGQQAAEQNYGNVFNQDLAAYQNNAQNYYQNQANQYSRLMGLTGAGQNAASNLAGIGTQYAGLGTNTIMGAAGNIGNYLLDKGTAAAQGSLGSANAWQGALNGIGQLGQIYGGGMNLFGGGGGGGGSGFTFPSNTVSDLGGFSGANNPYSSGYLPQLGAL
jgi:hypothetical protein